MLTGSVGDVVSDGGFTQSSGAVKDLTEKKVGAEVILDRSGGNVGREAARKAKKVQVIAAENFKTVASIGVNFT